MAQAVIIKRPRKARSDSESPCEIRRMGRPCGFDADWIFTAVVKRTGETKRVRTCDQMIHTRNAKKQMTEFATKHS